MGVLDSLEKQINSLEKTKQSIQGKKNVLQGEIQGQNKSFWRAFVDGYKVNKKKKPGIILRTLTQIILFFVNFAIFNYFLDIFGWEETVFLILISLLTIVGYIAYTQSQERV